MFARIVVTFFFLLSLGVQAATQIAPANRVNLFLDSTGIFGASDYTEGTTPSLGTVKILKSNGNTETSLALNLYNTGISGSNARFLMDVTYFNNTAHVRLSDRYNSAKGQCVDFAKSMIGSTSPTSTWHTGTLLGSIPTNQLSTQLAPGTMIAYFGTYTNTTYSAAGQHVAIVLSVVRDVNGNPTGLNVVHQNFLVSPFNISVGGILKGAAPQTIAKHFLRWNDTSGLRSASQYRIVDLYGYQYT